MKRLDRPPDDGELLEGDLHGRGKLMGRGLAAELLLQLSRGLFPFGDQLDHIGRDVDRLDRVDERALDRLFDPPGGVGGEAGSLGRIETLHGPDETDVALLDQVGERQAPVRVVLTDGDDEAQVGLDHLLLGILVVFVDDTPAELLLLLRGEQRDLVDLLQVQLQIGLQGGVGHADPLAERPDAGYGEGRVSHRTGRCATSHEAIRRKSPGGCRGLFGKDQHVIVPLPTTESNKTYNAIRVGMTSARSRASLSPRWSLDRPRPPGNRMIFTSPTRL